MNLFPHVEEYDLCHLKEFLQIGTESDGDTPNWKVEQFNMAYLPASGGTTQLANLDFIEETANYDPATDSSISYIYQGGQAVPMSVGSNPGNVQGDYHHIDSNLNPGTIYWWRGPPVVTPGSQLWP